MKYNRFASLSDVRRRCCPRRRRLQRARSAGMVLNEIVIALALAGVVFAGSSALLMQAYANQTAYQQQLRVQQYARAALDSVVDDLKGAVRFNSSVTSGGTTTLVPSQSVLDASAGSVGTPPNLTDYTHPLSFDIYDDNNPPNLRRVRYWMRRDPASNTYDLRREIVTDSLDSSGNRTLSLSATSADAGKIVARCVTKFTAQTPYDSQSNYAIVRVTLQITDGAAASQSVVTLQDDVTIRNDMF